MQERSPVESFLHVSKEEKGKKKTKKKKNRKEIRLHCKIK